MNDSDADATDLANPTAEGSSPIAFQADLVAGEVAVPCQVLSISASGAKVRLDEPWLYEPMVKLRIGTFLFESEIIWQYGCNIGLSFFDDPHDVDIILQTHLARLRDPSDRRRFNRVSILMSGRLFSGEMMADCVVLNISLGGAKVRVLQFIEFLPTVILRIDRFGEFPGKVVWQDGNYIGFRFLLNPQEVEGRVAERLPRIRDKLTPPSS